MNKDTAARCFQDQHYGFGVITSGACLGVDGKGKAPHWRLTEVGYMADPPTRDFLRWDGVIFQEAKNKTLYEKSGHPVRKPGRKTRTVVSEKPGQLAAEVSEKFGHRSDHGRRKPGHNWFNHLGARAGSGLGAGDDRSASAVEEATGPSHKHPVSILPTRGSWHKTRR